MHSKASDQLDADLILSWHQVNVLFWHLQAYPLSILLIHHYQSKALGYTLYVLDILAVPLHVFFCLPFMRYTQNNHINLVYLYAYIFLFTVSCDGCLNEFMKINLARGVCQ